MNKKPVSTFAVYTALLIIVALGAVMFFTTYRLIIALTALFLTSGSSGESVVSASYTLQVASMCGAIVLGGAGLILLPLGERYLRRKAALRGSLSRPFLRIVAGQLVYVVGVLGPILIL